MNESDLLKKIESIKTNADLFELLKEEPPQSWIKQHSEIANYKFLPIDKVEFLLRSIFKFNFRYEVLDTKEIFNSNAVTMRVHFREFDEPKNWLYFDGVGAEEPEKIKAENVKTKDFTDYAVSAALPNAKSNAVKNACYGFGKLFGSDLNRNDTISKEPKTSNEKKLEELKKLYSEKKAKIDFDSQLHIERIIEEKESIDYQKIINELNLIK